MVETDVITYDAEILAQHLRIGNPIHHEGVYATVTAIIRDNSRRRVIAQTQGDDDEVTRVFEIAYDTWVQAGMIIQYGIDRPGRRHVMPVHPGHGTRARQLALTAIARRGGTLMTRPVIPDTDTDLGVRPLADFQPAA